VRVRDFINDRSGNKMHRYNDRRQSNKLRLDKSNNILSGVCAGIAEYTNLNVGLIRIATVVGACFTELAPMIIAYIILACVLD
jgi:phage shock protein C